MKYTTYGKFDVQSIIELIKSPETHTVLDGHRVSVSGNRLRNFSEHGTDCICCGAKGEYFSLETNSKKPPEGLHLNLYARNKYGDMVMMTKDHKVLKSLGGPNELHNYSPMCLACNNLRGNKYPVLEDFLELYRNGYFSGGDPDLKALIAETRRLKRERQQREIEQLRLIDHQQHVYHYHCNKRYLKRLQS